MIEFYAKKVGAQPFTSHVLETFPEMNIQEIRRLQRQFWNAFKHATHQHGGAERDDDELLKGFTDEQNDHALFIGWYDYAVAVSAMPVEAQVHQAWYLAMHPDKLAAQYPSDLYEKVFPNLKGRTRAEQKRMLNEVIARTLKDDAVMSDPATEKGPLVAGWPPN
ncbi:hypothetical protein XH88_36795 [Bradyrhizobium sp. CCBAU 51627]|nr:hypothetical protein [Bradyrhizobium sp. CCBAU 51627]